MNMYSSQSYCISFFYLQIKPFYMDVFYLHSLWSYLHKFGVISQDYGVNSKGLRR